MPQLHLPQQHSDADLILAGQIADLVGSGELFVAWTHDEGPGARPAVAARMRTPLNPVAELFGLLLDSAADIVRAISRPSAAQDGGTASAA